MTCRPKTKFVEELAVHIGRPHYKLSPKASLHSMKTTGFQKVASDSKQGGTFWAVRVLLFFKQYFRVQERSAIRSLALLIGIASNKPDDETLRTALMCRKIDEMNHSLRGHSALQKYCCLGMSARFEMKRNEIP